MTVPEAGGSRPVDQRVPAPLGTLRLTAGLLALLAGGYLTGLAYLDLQAGLPIPVPMSRIDAVHVASGIGAMAFAICLAVRLRRGRRNWSRWMNGLLTAAAALYAGVLVTGVIILFPLPADLADELTHAHLIAAVWAAEPTLALFVELGRRGDLRRPRPAPTSVREGSRTPSGRRGRAVRGGLLGLAALGPAIVLAVVAPRALSPSAQRGGYRSWTPIGPRVITDVAMPAPGGGSVIAGGYGLYRVSLDGSSLPLGDFAGQDVLSLLRGSGGSVYVGTGLGLYRAPALAGPYRRLPLPAGGVHGIAVEGSRIWASSFYGFWLSGDGGAHWRQVNAGVEYPYLSWALINDGGTVYGSDVSGVYRFAGDRWDRVSSEEGVFTFSLAGGRLFAAGEGGGVWVRRADGEWTPSDNGLVSHNQGTLQGIHEFSVTPGADGRMYGGSMLDGGDVSLDGGGTWSQQWPNLSRDAAVYRILPVGDDLVAATDRGLLVYPLPTTAPAGLGWWAVLVGATLALSLLTAAALLPRRSDHRLPVSAG